MADPKGPETGQGDKGHSARPRPQTLDLSATDVSPKPAPDAAKPAEQKPAGPAASTSSAASSASSTSSGLTPKASATASTTGAPAAAKAEPTKTEAPKPADSKTVDPKTVDPKAAASQASAAKPGAPTPGPAKPEASRPVAPTAGADLSGEAPAARREGVGMVGVVGAALGSAAIAVIVIAAFGKTLIGANEPDMTRVAAAEAKLDAVGRDIAALRSSIAKTAQSTDTSAIDAKIEGMAKSVSEAGDRVSGVETELKSLSEQAAKPDAALGVLAGRVDGLELRLQQGPTTEALDVLAGRIAGIEARTADLPSKDQVAAMGKRVDEATGPLTKQVQDVAAALKARPEGDPAARLVVSLGALDQAVAAGRPFAAELNAVKAAAGPNAELSSLDAFAMKGIPTRAALGTELAAEIDKLPPLKPRAEGSVFQRFVANAGGVVKVTPQGGPTGDDPEAMRTRVRAAAAAGDVEQALAMRGQLDEAARAATENWSQLATAKLAADNAVGAARAAALARLTAND